MGIGTLDAARDAVDDNGLADEFLGIKARCLFFFSFFFKSTFYMPLRTAYMRGS